MLSLAIKARIPIIRAHTTDLLNLPDVLAAIAPGMKIVEFKGTSPAGGELLYALDDTTVTRNTYENMAEAGKVLLLINQEEGSPFVFDAGEVPVPKSLMEDLLEQVVAKKVVPELVSCFNGLTLKGMSEIIRLVTAKDKSLTARGIMSMRATITGKLQGLGQVDTDMPLYLCPDRLKEWVECNQTYFMEAIDERLVPRGILLNGEPGVGKSQAAKYIANELGVPLYRLDLSSSLGKWVGESEANLGRILTMLDQEEPCVLLVDEVEKVFGEREDSGVTSRLLAQLLWWLQEHTSRVLTVMTTNDMNALPKELYRAGRIDMTLTIDKLSQRNSLHLATAVLKQFVEKPTPSQGKVLYASIRALCLSSTGEDREHHYKLSHAVVVQCVYDLIKANKWVK